MATLEHRNHARSFLRKAEEYLASAEVNLTAERYTVAAGDAIHAGICAKDAIVTELTGSTVKGKDHSLAVKELRRALGQRPDAAGVGRYRRQPRMAARHLQDRMQVGPAGRAQCSK